MASLETSKETSRKGAVTDMTVFTFIYVMFFAYYAARWVDNCLPEQELRARDAQWYPVERS